MRRSCGRGGAKRSRTAEVHNLSERVSMQSISVQRLIPDSEARATIELIALYLQRRRDRINEKMRALQELIPNCNKV